MPEPRPPSVQEIGALVALVNEDRLAEAERATRALLSHHPNAGMLWKILSVTLLRSGQDALPALRRTVELMPADSEAHHNLGAALYEQGLWADALLSLQAALKLQPDAVGAQIDCADTLRQLGRAGEAVPLYQRALQLEPRQAEAQNNLGNAYLQLRRHADAEECYRRALLLKPEDAQILCNLAQACAAQGRRAEAAAQYQAALRSRPDSVEALSGLGNVLRELGNRREAVALYRRCLEIDPRRADLHCHLGMALFELRRVDEAAACYRRALALRPDYAPAHLSLGIALRQQRAPAEAEASCQAALAIDAEYPDALALLGELKADLGQFSEAERLFRRAIAANPDYAAAYAGIATHRRMTSEDADWLRGAEALLARPLPLSQAIALQYALGKYHDDLKNYPQAFAHYRQANEWSKRHGEAHDRAKLSARVDQLIGSLDASFLKSAAARGSDSELPVLIVGMPRSGTSLLEQMLASHPAVFGAGELVFWNGAYDSFREAEASAGARADQLPAIARSYLERLRGLAGDAARVIDKMPANFWYLGLIHAAFPRARVIHMQRHPIDTCLSIYFQNFFNIGAYAHDLADLAHFYTEYQRIMRHWRALLPASALLEVPYEALTDDPELWARRVVEFIGLPWDPRCLDFDQTHRAVITASKWQVRQKIHKGSVGRWRNYEAHIGALRALAP